MDQDEYRNTIMEEIQKEVRETKEMVVWLVKQWQHLSTTNMKEDDPLAHGPIRTQAVVPPLLNTEKCKPAPPQGQKVLGSDLEKNKKGQTGEAKTDHGDTSSIPKRYGPVGKLGPPSKLPRPVSAHTPLKTSASSTTGTESSGIPTDRMVKDGRVSHAETHHRNTGEKAQKPGGRRASKKTAEGDNGACDVRQSKVCAARAAAVASGLLPCPICQRCFKPPRLETHTQICAKLQHSEMILSKSIKKKGKGALLQSNVDMNNIEETRAANSNDVKCPHCSRCMPSHLAQTHMPMCGRRHMRQAKVNKDTESAENDDGVCDVSEKENRVRAAHVAAIASGLLPCPICQRCFEPHHLDSHRKVCAWLDQGKISWSSFINQEVKGAQLQSDMDKEYVQETQPRAAACSDVVGRPHSSRSMPSRLAQTHIPMCRGSHGTQKKMVQNAETAKDDDGVCDVSERESRVRASRAAAIASGLLPCPICQRCFIAKRLDIHSQICAKLHEGKIILSGPVKLKVKGAQLQSDMDKKYVKETQPKAAACSDVVGCPHCSRSMPSRLAQTHIPKCGGSHGKQVKIVQKAETAEDNHGVRDVSERESTVRAARAAAVASGLLPCPICERCFLAKRLDTHHKICAKLNKGKISLSSPDKQEVKGARLQSDMDKEYVQETQPRAAACSDVLRCPHCSRRMPSRLAQTHIPMCRRSHGTQVKIAQNAETAEDNNGVCDVSETESRESKVRAARAAAVASGLLPCPICERCFLANRLETHRKICAKISSKKRGVYKSP